MVDFLEEPIPEITDEIDRNHQLTNPDPSLESERPAADFTEPLGILRL